MYCNFKLNKGVKGTKDLWEEIIRQKYEVLNQCVDVWFGGTIWLCTFITNQDLGVAQSQEIPHLPNGHAYLLPESGRVTHLPAQGTTDLEKSSQALLISARTTAGRNIV